MLPGSLKMMFNSFKNNASILWMYIQRKNKLNQLDIAADELKFYTKSQIFLHYLHNESKKHPVSATNCLSEIYLQTKFSDWNFVPGNRNLADLCTQPTCIKKITENGTCTNGPMFFIQCRYLFKQFWCPLRDKNNSILQLSFETQSLFNILFICLFCFCLFTKQMEFICSKDFSNEN